MFVEQGEDLKTYPAYEIFPVKYDFITDLVAEMTWISLLISRETNEGGLHFEHGNLLLFFTPV